MGLRVWALLNLTYLLMLRWNMETSIEITVLFSVRVRGLGFRLSGVGTGELDIRLFGDASYGPLCNSPLRSLDYSS